MRRAIRARVSALDPTARALEEARLVSRLESLPGFDRSRTVLLYASTFGEEIDTRPILDAALRIGKRVACPKVVESERRLRLFEVIEPAVDLVASPRGIPEARSGCPEIDPAEVDWALVPGLAFDRRGFRLGRGAGLYDRLLPMLGPETRTWALILEAQWVDRVPTEPHDRPIGGIADFRAIVDHFTVTRS